MIQKQIKVIFRHSKKKRLRLIGDDEIQLLSIEMSPRPLTIHLLATLLVSHLEKINVFISVHPTLQQFQTIHGFLTF